MDNATNVMEYKCPCCTAGLRFSGIEQKLTCEYCETTFELDAVLAFNETESQNDISEVTIEKEPDSQWSADEKETLRVFMCPSCGGEIITDAHTVASFCPYCDNPTIMPGRLSGDLKPDALIPFCTSKENAKAAFLNLCKGKPLLPKMFTQEQQLEKITGMYVPFWLYDCDGAFDGNYKATRMHHWSDSRYNYTRTEHFLLKRAATASFTGIPMDGSSKMDDTFMESIEPFDYSGLTAFDTAYLTGYLADKYDVSSESGKQRIQQRVDRAMNDRVQSSLVGYATVIPTGKQLHIDHSTARYVLFPVWILNTRYRGKLYTFAMNGQTGKMTGAFPVCPKRTGAWFAGICSGVSLIAFAVQLLMG